MPLYSMCLKCIEMIQINDLFTGVHLEIIVSLQVLLAEQSKAPFFKFVVLSNYKLLTFTR